MTKVIAALDSSLAARPVLATALELARLLGTDVEPLHVAVDGDLVPRRVAEHAGLELRTAEGPVVDRLLDVGRAEDTAALVVGARGTTISRRPLGSTALAVATSLPKPVVVVPPDALGKLRRILVPLEANRTIAAAPRAIFEVAAETALEVVVLHVHDEDSIPLFTDQPQHEHAAWAHEFVRRYCPWGVASVSLERRVGRIDELVPIVVDEVGADLIALGWSQDLAPGRARVVRAVLERTHVPVLLVPVVAPASEKEEQCVTSLSSPV